MGAVSPPPVRRGGPRSRRRSLRPPPFPPLRLHHEPVFSAALPQPHQRVRPAPAARAARQRLVVETVRPAFALRRPGAKLRILHVAGLAAATKAPDPAGHLLHQALHHRRRPRLVRPRLPRRHRARHRRPARPHRPPGARPLRRRRSLRPRGPRLHPPRSPRPRPGAPLRARRPRRPPRPHPRAGGRGDAPARHLPPPLRLRPRPQPPARPPCGRGRGLRHRRGPRPPRYGSRMRPRVCPGSSSVRCRSSCPTPPRTGLSGCPGETSPDRRRAFRSRLGLRLAPDLGPASPWLAAALLEDRGNTTDGGRRELGAGVDLDLARLHGRAGISVRRRSGLRERTVSASLVYRTGQGASGPFLEAAGESVRLGWSGARASRTFRPFVGFREQRTSLYGLLRQHGQLAFGVTAGGGEAALRVEVRGVASAPFRRSGPARRRWYRAVTCALP